MYFFKIKIVFYVKIVIITTTETINKKLTNINLEEEDTKDTPIKIDEDYDLDERNKIKGNIYRDNNNNNNNNLNNNNNNENNLNNKNNINNNKKNNTNKENNNNNNIIKNNNSKENIDIKRRKLDEKIIKLKKKRDAL